MKTTNPKADPHDDNKVGDHDNQVDLVQPSELHLCKGNGTIQNVAYLLLHNELDVVNSKCLRNEVQHASNRTKNERQIIIRWKMSKQKQNEEHTERDKNGLEIFQFDLKIILMLPQRKDFNNKN